MRNVYTLERSEDYTMIFSTFKKAEKVALEYVGEIIEHKKIGKSLNFYYGKNYNLSATISEEPLR
jgi:hypothetical protein|tara:strand:- start:223 stop:417 length:195 start_codon:yes stop_codon:yes gene_type:complete